MATVADNSSSAGRGRGVRRAKKHSLKVDMTPMVDLGFLLIAFFVMTTEMDRPAKLDLVMPKDGPPTGVKSENALSFLLTGNDIVYYYEGEFEEAKEKNRIFTTGFHQRAALGKVITRKQAELDASKSSGKSRDDLMMIIKAGDDANYKNVIDALDEALIYDVKRYVVVKTEKVEDEYIRGK